MVVIKNSHIEKLDPREEWQKRLRAKAGNPWGMYTTVGHAYSLILERLDERGLDSRPEPRKFLRLIERSLEYTSFGTERALGLFKLDFNSKTYYPEFTRPIIQYMRDKGLDSKDCEEILFEILGTKGY